MDSPKKASVKHIEFQLQREKALTKDLEAKCKDFHAQIARLEQEKAELRREKLQLAEETKKSTRYEDRIHVLQKELECKEAIISQERTRAMEARAETEEVRFNANASIASWKQAEEQWIAEQAALSETVTQQRDDLEALRGSFEANRAELAETQRTLQKERERCAKIDGSREKLEAELREMHVKVEKCQNQIFDLEQKVYKLDLAGEKQRDALSLKDAEIHTLEAKVAKQAATEERMEQTISSLNDRINAAKMVNLEGKGEKENLLCDLADARKENQRLAMQVDSLKRDAEFAAQTQSTLQKANEELREKCRAAQEDLREKSVEVRKHELTISQLTVELKRLESSTSEGSLRCTSLETENHQLKEEVKKLHSVIEQISEERDTARDEAKQLKAGAEKRDEDVVLLKSQMEDRVESLQEEIRNWEVEVSKRQCVIQDLTEQLGSTNEKNTSYYRKLLEESEVCAKLRRDLERLREIVSEHERSAVVAQCVDEKRAFLATFYEEEQDTLNESFKAMCSLNATLVAQLRRQEETLFAQERRVQELTDMNGKTAAQLEETQQQLHVALATCKTLEETVTEKEARRLSSAEKDSAGKEEIAKLHQALAKLAEDARAAEVAHQEETAILKRRLIDQASRAEQYMGLLMEQLTVADEWWQSKAAHACAYERDFAASRDAEMVALLTEKERLERQAQELTAFVEEVKVSSNRKGVALAEKQEAQLKRIQSLESQLQLVTKEKEQVSFQLSGLLSRFEGEQKASERAKKEAQDILKEEQARREAAEKQCAKLRSGIDYEIKRKCEYKAALEEVKHLREETERCRQREKSFATDAIKKANEEATYWIKSFEKLKTLAEAARRNGTRLPSIDQDTLTRLASAREKMDSRGEVAALASGPIREHPANVAPSAAEAVDSWRTKRARTDSR